MEATAKMTNVDHLLPDSLIWREIEREVIAAREQYPGNEHRIAALAGEVGELAQALTKGEGKHRIRREAIQVAAMAVRIIEEGDGDFA